MNDFTKLQKEYAARILRIHQQTFITHNAKDAKRELAANCLVGVLEIAIQTLEREVSDSEKTNSNWEMAEMGDRETLNKIFAIMRNLLIVPMDGLNPIPRKGTTKRECYRALWEIQELLGVRRIGCKHIAQTNADRIRAMSDEELADWVSGITRCDYCPVKPCKSLYHCETQWLDWLQSPVGGMLSE